MTVSELYNSVAQLGFEDSLESNSRFVYAANRALLQVNAIRPATSSYVINHRPTKNAITESSFDPVLKIEDVTYYANNVKAFYFESDGIGTVYFEKIVGGEWTEFYHLEMSATNGFKSYRGFIRDGGEYVDGIVRMRFAGQYIYSVRNVAMYEHLYSNSEKDIPAYEAFTRYDIKELTGDFLSLAMPLIEGTGFTRMPQGYDVEDNRIILLPYTARGVYKVTYNRIPRAIVNEGDSLNDDTVIDLAEDLCALVPLLVAAYIFIDDEPEKAQYYLSLYREMAIDIERRKYNATPATIVNVNGW